MYEIKVNPDRARIEVRDGDYYWEQSGHSPSKAVHDLLFFMEAELTRLESVDYDDLTSEAQEKMEVLRELIKGSGS